MKCNRFGLRSLIYGLIKNTETNGYLMAFQCADNGGLNKFLKKALKILNASQFSLRNENMTR